MATVRLANGRVLLATGREDHNIRLWNAHTRLPFERTLNGHTKAIYAMATLMPYEVEPSRLASGT